MFWYNEKYKNNIMYFEIGNSLDYKINFAVIRIFVLIGYTMFAFYIIPCILTFKTSFSLILNNKKFTDSVCISCCCWWCDETLYVGITLYAFDTKILNFISTFYIVTKNHSFWKVLRFGGRYKKNRTDLRHVIEVTL
jgi:hypothetical protein